jgi:hypothetical protein
MVKSVGIKVRNSCQKNKDLVCNIIAQRCCRKSTQHKDTKHTKKKNNDHFNLSLCLLWFLGGFVFEDSFAK